MRCFSLFSGIGGFDLALQRQGHEIIGACEIDKHARTIYARHFSGVKIWEDATKINPKDIPEFNILTAGFPCQSFSTAGKRLGFEESRGTIFFEIARIAKQKRPKLLFLENVPGILNHEEGRTFAQVLNTLHEMGYDFEWTSFNSEHFVRHDRERVFIIGRLGEKCPRKIFPFGESCKVSDRRKKSPSVRTFTFGSKTCGHHSQMTMIMISNTKANIRNRVQQRHKTWTLDCTGNHFVIQDGDRFRKLMPIECERLQGFPDNWTEGIADTWRYACLGNAVTVPVVEYILERMT